MEKHRHNDNLFKKILEDHPEFDVPKADINDMRSRLNAVENPQRRRGFLAWLIPLLLLPIMLGMGYLFYQNHQLTLEVQSLQNQLITVKKDTIEQQHITYVYDTLYNTIHKETLIRRTVYPDKNNSSNIAFSSVLNRFTDSRTLPFLSENAFNTPFDKYSSNKNFTKNLLSKFNNDLNQLSNKPEAINSSLAFANDSKSKWRTTPILALDKKISFLEKEIDLLENIILKESNITFKKRRKNPLHYMRPKGFLLGISGNPLGVATYSNPYKNNLTSYGLSSELEYNKNIRLNIGLYATQYNKEFKDPTVIANFPAITPNSPTDMIREYYLSLYQIQVPISIKYLFYKNQKITPFIAGGFAASRSAQQSFKTEFITNTFEEYSLAQNFSDGTFSIKNLRGAVGLEYDINSKWAASTEAYYYHDLELDLGEYFLMRNLGLNLSLKRKW